MPENRRNYYRILQVQPEAPPEVIKASWRALMGGARRHPDLGGDHASAVLINQAYAVLSDPERRRAYDRLLDVARLRAPAAGARTGPGPAPPRGDASRRDERACPMCRHALPAELRADSRCARCDAPLAPPPRPAAGERELFGRRAAARRPRSDTAVLYVDWRADGVPARLVDLSTGGAGLAAAAPAGAGTAVRLVTPALDAVARVVSCHRIGERWRLRVQWLTARPLGARGVYVSVRA